MIRMRPGSGALSAPDRMAAREDARARCQQQLNHQHALLEHIKVDRLESGEDLQRPLSVAPTSALPHPEHSVNSAGSFATRLAFHRIDHQTTALLREARSLVIDALPGILDRFYDHVGRFAQTARFFRNREHMMHAKQMQLKHWSIILEGRFDADYEASVTRIGEIHSKLGLEPSWYIGGYNALLSDLVSEVAIRMPARVLRRGSAQKQAAMQRAIVNAALLDMDIALAVYTAAERSDRRQMLDGLATDFETAIGGVVDIVASASTALQAAAQSPQGATDRTPA
jgi:hypothetical protein